MRPKSSLKYQQTINQYKVESSNIRGKKRAQFLYDLQCDHKRAVHISHSGNKSFGNFKFSYSKLTCVECTINISMRPKSSLKYQQSIN